MSGHGGFLILTWSALVGDKTGISWSESTWNPIVGCSKVSPGCAKCYAETLALRWGWTPKPWLPENAAENVFLKPERLAQPIRWKRPRKIFVNSLSDVFHEQVPNEFIDRIFAVMMLAPQHTYQVLTKRPERMREYFDVGDETIGLATMNYRQRRVMFAANMTAQELGLKKVMLPTQWPLRNVWLGTSVENARWRTRIDDLRQTPSAVRFLSCEPLLGPLVCPSCKGWGFDVNCDPSDPTGQTPMQVPCQAFGHEANHDLDLKGIEWVIVGGESGPGARPMDESWVRDIRDACERQDVALWVKQMGEVWSRANLGHGGHAATMEEFPKDLRIQEFPAAEYRSDVAEQGAFVF